MISMYRVILFSIISSNLNKFSLQPTFVAYVGFVSLILQFDFSGHDSLSTVHPPSQTTARRCAPQFLGAPGRR